MVQRYKNESKSQRYMLEPFTGMSCFQWFKDTKMKANHNRINEVLNTSPAVSNGSKIQK